MDESIQKLINDGRWQPIKGAPRDENGYLALCNFTPDHAGRIGLPFFGRWSTKVSRFVAGGGACAIPTHFRPLPDDRLANALEVAVAAGELSELTLQKIQDIAEGKA